MRAAGGGAPGQGKRTREMWSFTRGGTDDVLRLWQRWVGRRRAKPRAESINLAEELWGMDLQWTQREREPA